MTEQRSPLKIGKKQVISVALVGLLAYTLLTQLGSASQSLHLLSAGNPGLLLLAVLCTAATYIFATATYLFLSIKRLLFGRTVIVQLAAMFINRLVPSGVGALGANYVYLRRERHTTTQAATIISLNNILGLTAHALLLGVTLLLFGKSLPALRAPHVPPTYFLGLLILAGILTTFAILRPRLRQRVTRFFAGIGKELLSYRNRPGKVGLALGSSMLLTLANVLTLLFCLQAVGGNLPFVAILLAFSAGIGVGAAIPTPGGLGGVEAGIAGGLIAYQVPHSTAVATVIAFRLISYWLALLFGAVALVVAQRRNYFG